MSTCRGIEPGAGHFLPKLAWAGSGGQPWPGPPAQGPWLCPSGWEAWQGSGGSGPAHWPHHNHGGHPAAGPLGLSDHTSPLHLSGKDPQTQPEEKAGWSGGQRTEVFPGLLQSRLSEPCLGGCRVLKSAGVTGSVGDEGGIRPRSGLLTSIHPVPGTYHSASHLRSCQGAALSPSLESPAAPRDQASACADPCLSPQPGGLCPPSCHMRKLRLRWGHSEGAGVPTLEPPGCPQTPGPGVP